ncbi:3-beta-hydroxy-Delta(5)-steroid dehydrogenase [Azorhizobium oxalatiphilum]|uniref:3-beta-hydroxy-Delta(5)-steroid dehydrogenase n=1 Tax=Azorhizobium oxalatiphilum TaxID=980631 RepID=A0A917F6Y4_9HYPH|nr:complex I NDUFA9 subunit family protein [Azorhizobium oxalatiphilum]GGF49823.1 3-beta-hydroxy-Delta(5)-steroid dehydrogenase [Azorhizobium oxalatiphilum]
MSDVALREQPMTDTLVTVFGGSGFVGRHVVRALARRGYRVRVAVRRPQNAGFLQPLGYVGQIQIMQANVRYPASVQRAVEGASVVVNLVGILKASGRQSFEAVQAAGGRTVAEAAAAAGAKVVHLSAIGAALDAPSIYARTKAEGEAAVLAAVPDAVILRSSVVFGPEDDFFNKFAGMARFSPALPLIGGGETKFQPVFVGDVAQAVEHAVSGQAKPGATYELGGPEVRSFKELMQTVLREIGAKRCLCNLPFGLASLFAGLTQWLPMAPLTKDQVTLLKSDNVVSDAAQKDGRTLAGLGVQPTAMASMIGSYLWRFRKSGQFTHIET